MSRKSASKTDKLFSEQIRKARKHRPDKSNFTSQIVADAIGINRATYSRKEKGKSPWTFTEAVEVCRFLGITMIEVKKNE